MKTIINTLKAIILIACIITLSSMEGFSKTNQLQRYGAIGFSIGSKGYIGTGYGYVYSKTPYRKDFWEYNPSTDSWTQKADFGGGLRAYAAGFCIGDKGYIGMGFSGTIYPADFWQYNPSTNTWTRKTDFAGGKRTTPVCFSIGTKGYVGTGRGSVLNADGCYDTKELWEYDPNTGTGGTWNRKSDFGGIERQGASGFSIGEKGYIGIGIHYIGTGNYTFLNDLWEYDPVNDIWAQKSNTLGLGRAYAMGFSVGTMGYIGTGNNSTANGGYLKDFQEYNPETNTWNQKATFTGIERGLSVGFSIGTKGYIGTGDNGIDAANYLADFWEYNQITNVWTQKTDFGSKHKGNLKDNVVEESAPALNELIVYPNPSNSTFNFRLKTTSEQLVTIQIFDMFGRLVHEYKSLSPNDITTIGDKLDAGVFIAVVTQGEFRKTVKITKVN